MNRSFRCSTLLAAVVSFLAIATTAGAQAQVANDTDYKRGLLWGMYGDSSHPASMFGSQAAEAWANGRSDCSSVYIGIISDGLMTTHDDLLANVGTNPGDSTFDGVDNDGNGYIDDVHGWDFLRDDNSVFDGLTFDQTGTLAAGVVGAVGNNRKGVVGVCWRVKLLAARVVSMGETEPDETTAAVARAIDYMTDLKLGGVNLVATLNTWGTPGYGSALESHSQDIQDAIARAGAAGVLFITGSGDDGVDLDSAAAMPWHGYPARYAGDHVIAVASINEAGGLHEFSNRGASTVDLGAPGVRIRSTVPSTDRRGRLASGYATGNFMGASFVAGAAALYKAYHPTASAAQIKAAIMAAAVPTTSLQGKTLIGGRLDVSGF